MAQIFSAHINTGQEFDGSDTGARPDEAASWDKIKIEAKVVKLYADPTVMLPLSQTFWANLEKLKAEQSK
ncbi:Deoxyhypusine synthase-domain-containing protein [Chytriomyces cf. hyalinus JEL632]|nr:Deoxyhypusine synthase-domain-containing protein [Chytriomyces cf. hyalinus JEL632]